MLRDIRTNYQKFELNEETVNNDPILQLTAWLNDAIENQKSDPTAMVLSTIDREGNPESRVVLLKELKDEGLIFFTNYDSKKGQQITINPSVSVVFFWPELERQVRIKGKAEKISEALRITDKSVPAVDEDSATLSVSAALEALKRFNGKASDLGAVFVGSESHPYAVKPTATTVGEALNIGPNFHAADLEFACKAGTAAMQIVYAMVKAGMIRHGLAVGVDIAQCRPGDILEYSCGAGAAAFIFSQEKDEIIASIDDTCSVTTDTPDFYRRNGEKYPEHAGRFTGDPSYFKHTEMATKMILEKNNLRASDIDHVIFHQPNGKFPVEAAKRLGFNADQLALGLLAPHIGNTYAASSPLGLAAVLDEAKAGQRILLTSYGSGSGSDSFLISTTDLIEKKRPTKMRAKDFLKNRIDLDYTTYRKHLEHLEHGE